MLSPIRSQAGNPIASWATRFANSKRAIIASVALCLTIFVLQAAGSMRQKCVTSDEIMYIASGYYSLKTGRFDLNLTNPPLMKALPALPLLTLDLKLPAHDGDPSTWSLSRQWRYSREFLYDNNVDADRILFIARLPVVGLGVVLGLFVFSWARQLYGSWPAVLALFLYSFSPNILAHTRLATLDLGLSVFMFATVYYSWKLVHQPRLHNAVLCGVAFGAAVLTKTTAMFLVPVLGVYALVMVFRHGKLDVAERWPWVRGIDPARVGLRRLAALLAGGMLIVVVVVLTINLGYAFRTSWQPLSTKSTHPEFYEKLPLDSAVTRGAVDLLLNTPVPVPKAYLQVVRFQAGTASGGASIYFAGQISREGWWHMMLAAFLIKTPIAFLLLLGAGLVAARRRRFSDAEWLLLGTAVFVLALFSYFKNINVGLRYILPIYPLLHVLAARAVVEPGRWKRIGRLGLGVLLAWNLVGAVSIYPDYLAYFNEFIGGPKNGYRYLADSNLDWGQDLKQLERYMSERRLDRVRLAYFGSAEAEYYGIDYEYLPSVGLSPRKPGEKWWYEVGEEELPPLQLAGTPIAVSATLLAGVFYPGYYAPLRELEPVAHVGYSILIYDPDGTRATPDSRLSE